MTQNLKKCRNCGAIQEHSLQQTCPKCGTKNAFTEEKVKVKEKTIKKCKNCGTIQEHSLQSICPKCGTKNAFNMKNEEIISNKLGKDFICPKCLSFFGKENVPQKMVKKKDFTAIAMISFVLSLIVTIFICKEYVGAVTFLHGLDGLNGQIIGVFFEGFLVSFIGIFFIVNAIIPKPIQKCPVCGRKGDFVLAESKLGMKYVNKKIIKETVETNKDINSNSERQNNTINDIFSSWNEDKK